MKSNRKYWQSFGEMADSEAHRSRVLKKELSHHKKGAHGRNVGRVVVSGGNV